MKKGIGKKVLAAIMCLLVSLQMLPFVAAGATPKWDGSDPAVKSIDLKDNYSPPLPDDTLTPSDAYASALLKYKAVDADKKLYLRYDFALDETVTGAQYNAYVDSNGIPSDTDIESVDDADLPQIGFTFTIPVDDAAFEDVSSLAKTGVKLETEDHTEIGSYDVVYDAASNPKTLTVTGTLKKIVYKKHNVTGGLDLALKIIMDDDDTATPEIKVDGGEITVTVDVTPPAASYTLDKEATDFSGDYATYTIEATASHATLAGTTIADTIPQGLEITEVKLSGTTLSEDTATPGTDGKNYTLSTDTPPELKYTFPDTSTAKAATVTVKVKLDPESMTPEDYAKYRKGEALSFDNTARLLDDTDAELEEDTATADLPAGTNDNPNSFMTKEGKRTALNSPDYDWTITAQTYFTSGDTVYLIDSVDDIAHTHMYRLNGSNNVEITVNGGSTPIEAVLVTGNKTYAELMAGGLTKTEFETLVDSNDAVYYTFNNQAILIIPFTATELSTPVTIQYQTKAKKGTDGTFQADLNNKAGLLWWDGTGGTGGTGAWDHSATINKTVNADYTLIKKAPTGNYDESKHQQQWRFVVNQAGQPLNGVSITDELGVNGQKFVSLTYRKGALGSDGKVTFSGAQTDISLKPADSPVKPYYELGTNESLTISLPDITDAEVYELTLVTEVVDPVILAKQGSSELKNAAVLHYDTNKTQPASGTTDISNTLIQKAKVGTYDFNTHGVTWKVTVNPNHVPITSGVVTDELPVGAVFGTLTGAQQIKKGASTTVGTIDAGEKKVTFGSDTVTWGVDDTAAKNWAPPTEGAITPPARGTVTFTLPAAESTDSYVFTFTTPYPDAYRDNFFTFTGAASLTVRNDVVLDGTVKGEDIDASAYAENTVSAPPVAKTGTFPAGKQWVDWTIVLNKDKIDLSNATVKDTLKEWFALDESSFSISSTTIAADGTTGAEMAIPAEQLNKFGIVTSQAGFQFNIPSDYKTTPLVVKFRTYFLENTEHTSMTNEVSLKWGKSNETGSGPKTPGGTANFDMSSYATATDIRLLQITKTDTAGPLAGAEFTLTPFEWDDVKGEWILNATKAVIKTTTNKGFATFLFLNEGTPYRLEETKTPDSSYVRDETVRYFVFGTTPAGKPVPAKWGAQTVPLTTYNYSLSIGNVKTSETGTIIGKKTTANGVTGLAGANIGLFLPGANSPLQSVLSGSDGSFTFYAAPGDYEIKEVEAPSGYYLSNKTISVKITTAGETVTADTNVPPVPILITNDKIPSTPGNPGGGGGNPGGGTGRGYIVIQKSVEGDDALSGFTFEITDGKTYTERFVTDENGRIETGDLPAGTYTVREISVTGVTDKYVLPEAQTVHISSFGTKLNFENKLLPEFIPPDEVPLGGGGGTEPSSPVEEIPDNDVPKGTVETFGPKTGYTGASPLWALMLGLSLAGLGYSVISLLVSRKKGRHVDK